MRLIFGAGQPGVAYAPRPAAFGLAVRDGLLACVEIDRGEGPYLDLPGGALDGDESEPVALKREPDHALVWVAPVEALRRLRHEAHAWAVAVWLRSS